MSDSQVAREFLRQSAQLLDQSLIKVRHCLDQLSGQQIWWRPDESQNSIGNLLLHIGGNLQQWAVAGLTDQIDQRHRQAEFEARGSLTAAELLQLVESTVERAKQTFDQLNDKQLLRPRQIQGFPVTSLAAIAHTTSHFVGHTHQIVLLTRLQLGHRY